MDCDFCRKQVQTLAEIATCVFRHKMVVNVSIHYYRTEILRPQGSREEVFISPELLMLKVYSIVAKLDVNFVREFFPTVDALGVLPAAYINRKPADAHKVLAGLRSITELDCQKSVASDCTETFADREGLNLLIQSVLSEVLDYTLWVNSDCYSKYTKPIYQASTPRISADWICAMKQRTVAKNFRNRNESHILGRLTSLLDTLNATLSTQKFLFADKPMTTDVILYSFLSPLLTIPPQLTPFEHLPLTRLRAFLLDFDDWLWQLSASRHPLTPTTSLVCMEITPQPAEENNAWKANAGFIAVCGLTAAAVVALSRR